MITTRRTLVFEGQICLKRVKSWCNHSHSSFKCLSRYLQSFSSHNLTFRILPKLFTFTRKMSFKFSDYDCVGFDLDNTLLHYNVTNMVQLEYRVLAKFMVEQRGYDREYLCKPLMNEDIDFMQKGLLLDFERGNILRICSEGLIRRASHGTKLLSNDQIETIYPHKKWEATDAFVHKTLDTWNGPMSLVFRCLLDYFDMPAALAFARAVDAIDNAKTETPKRYNIWPDVLDGLIDMFDGANFRKNTGDYFTQLVKEPSKYLRKCSPETIEWLRELKRKKVTYLITGSYVDFADFTANYAMGKDWRSLFDIVICNAKKPGFFTEKRPFVAMSGYDLDGKVTGAQLRRGGIYSQGNWPELREFFARICKNQTPKCLYVGDNLIQDIFVPGAHVEDCDTVVLSEEMNSEGVHQENPHPDAKTLNSDYWGSYFSLNDSGKRISSLWSHIIERHSKICIPSMEFVAQKSVDETYECFDQDDKKRSGYYPAKPPSLLN